MDKPLLVGLTGGIGSGKSAVADLLVDHGARVIDADKVSREVVSRGAPGLAEVVAEFGTDILAADGDLDRARMAQIAFVDPSARERLNAIVHPLVAARIDGMLTENEAGGVIVYDVPLLVEASVQDRHDFDLIVVVETPEELRIERLVRDRGMTEEQVRARMGSQASDEQRRAVADVVLNNDGGPLDLAVAVDDLWRHRLGSRTRHGR